MNEESTKIEQVFEAAFQLFTRHGYQKVSVNEIAQQAGVSPATIYNYFGTKDQLYIDMIMNWMDKQLAKYDRILNPTCHSRRRPKKSCYWKLII